MVSKYLPDKDPRVVNYPLEDLLDKMLFANVRHFVEKDGGVKFAPSEYLTDYLARQTAKAIHTNKDRPFFVYTAFNAPHTPLQALRSDYDQLAHIPDELTRVYGAMIMALDRGVGTILQALKEAGVDDNTIVIFTNDNGAPNWVKRHGANAPFRGWKGTLFEGGLRVPMFMQWPAAIKAGTVLGDMVGHVDILPTILTAATGGRVGGWGEGEREDVGDEEMAPCLEGPVGICLKKKDGVNLLPFLTPLGEEDNEGDVMGNGVSKKGHVVDGFEGYPHRRLFWRSGHYKALRYGYWKLQVAERPPVRWMYDLKQDPYEKTNIAKAPEYSDVMKMMMGELQWVDAKQSTPLWESITETAVMIDKFYEHDEKEDDEYVYWPN